MREITAIIQPHMLSKVISALRALAHFPGATITDCQGQGRGRGQGGHFEATPDNVFFAKKIRLEIYCSDAICNELVDVITRVAHTGNPGDGIVAVADVIRVARIRTDEEQAEAV